MIADPHKLGNPDAFDDLADMFLGQMGTVHAHDAAVGAMPLARPGQRPPDDRAPITPAERSAAAPKLTLVSTGVIDDEHRAPHADPPCVESLVLGHLPVMASAWAGQYVKHIAERTQAPVAMVRLHEAGARIELHVPSGLRPDVRVGSSFDVALSNIHALARRVVIVAPACHEMETVGATGVSRVTLLTSGDEAGIVAAYGLVKTVSAKLRESRQIEPQSVLRAAVMGAPPSRADYVLRRLQETTRSFLGFELKSDVCIARVGVGSPGLVLFDGPLHVTIEDLVAMVGLGPVQVIENSANAPSEVTSSGAAVQAEASHSSQPEPAAMFAANKLGMHKIGSTSPVVDSAPHPARPIPSADPRPLESPIPQPRGPIGRIDRAAAATRPVVAEPRALAAFIDGLEPIVVRCPYAEEIELAIGPADEDTVSGSAEAAPCSLHILVRAERYGDRARAVERLMVVAEWARVHRRVIELTLGDCARKIQGETTSHVFTDQPRAWRHLLDSSMRIHGLAPVHADAEWACVAVN